ncbi:MAG: YraN family protein [Rhodobacteraceae bacterium]|nr:YraN family protein [Paracoccaceae bacterium]
MSGALAVLSGEAAEQAVADRYRRDGYLLRDRRYRRQGGEIDLIMSDAAQIVFIEVKKARDFDTAAARLRPAQRARLDRTARHYLAQMPGGQDTCCRFDVALVDAVGRVQVIANAFA